MGTQRRQSGGDQIIFCGCSVSAPWLDALPLRRLSEDVYSEVCVFNPVINLSHGAVGGEIAPLIELRQGSAQPAADANVSGI